MKMQIVFPLRFMVTTFIVFPCVQSSLTSSTGDINWWCSQTPNPEPCKYHMSHIPESSASISRKQFLTMAEQTTLDEVVSESSYIKSLERRVINNAERSAWSDCLLFYNLTIDSLNKVLDVSRKSTAADIQIWLSAASTDILICRNGFSDVNVTTNIYPLISSNNVTQLISNCLAVNKVFYDQEKGNNQKEFRKSLPTDTSNIQLA